MKTSRTARLLALLIPALALVGGTCTEEKVVDLVIGFPTIVRLVAEGEINMHSDEDVVNVKDDIDLEAELLNAGIDPTTLEVGDVRIAQIFYRVIQPDAVASRRIENAALTVARVNEATGEDIGVPAILVENWNMNAGVGNVPDPEEWIDITEDIGQAGIDLLNAFIDECIAELQGGPDVMNPEIRYVVSGDSVPGDQETDFEYEIKVLFQGKVQKTFDVPFG